MLHQAGRAPQTQLQLQRSRGLQRAGARRSKTPRRVLQACASTDSPQHPRETAELWNVGIYWTKRPTHITDSLGNVPEESLENLVDPPSWDAVRGLPLRLALQSLTLHSQEGKLRLAKTIVARDLGVDVSVVSARLDALRVLIPDLGVRFDTMRPGDLARLALLPDVAAALLRLREIFPTANVSKMVARRPELLLMGAADVAARAEALRSLMPGVDLGSIVAEQPRLLNTETTRKALLELQRLMPGVDAARMLANDPSLLSSVDTGEDLILYDNGSLAQLQESLRGGPDAAPDGW